MKDFDSDRRQRRVEQEAAEKQFVIGGETFTMRTFVRPDVIAEWEDLSEQAGSVYTLEVVDRLVTGFIADEDGRDRWRALRERDDGDLLDLGDLLDVCRWLITEATGRPTTPSTGAADSTNGRQETGPSSRGESSSQEATPA